MRRLAEIDQGRRLRNVAGPEGAVRVDRGVDVAGKRRLKLLRLVGADERKADCRGA